MLEFLLILVFSVSHQFYVCHMIINKTLLQIADDYGRVEGISHLKEIFWTNWTR